MDIVIEDATTSLHAMTNTMQHVYFISTYSRKSLSIRFYVMNKNRSTVHGIS